MSSRPVQARTRSGAPSRRSGPPPSRQPNRAERRALIFGAGTPQSDADRSAAPTTAAAPKKRWSPAERESRGRTPDRRANRSDERPRSLEDRPSRSTDRPRSFEDRPRSFEDRPRRSEDRPRSFQDRPRFAPQGDRPGSTGRVDHSTDQMEWVPREAPTTADHAAAPGEGGFADLGVPALLADLLTAQAITEPFPIQRQAIPDAMAGRDVLGRGRTGSGKTLAFGLPLLTRLAATPPATTPGAVVLVPTRELALQVADVLVPLARVAGLSVTLMAGGMAYGPQLKALSRGVDVVVATPGRLIDLMEQGAADLGAVQVTVLDEADHMADLGFLPAVTTIMDAIPAGGQGLLFSATLDSGVDRLVRRYLSSPVTHQVDAAQASISSMQHHVLQVRPADKVDVTAEIASRGGRTVVFVRTQRGADRVAEQLRQAGVLAGALHGGLTQGARTRTMDAFKDGRLGVLVATDVAARGIHVDDVALVLQVDPPAGPKDYLHRSGRTARAGHDGIVVTLTLPHQRRDIARLVRTAGVETVPLDVEPGEALSALVGARRPSQQAVSEADYQRIVAPAPSASRGPRRTAGRTDRSGRPGRGYAGARRPSR